MSTEPTMRRPRALGWMQVVVAVAVTVTVGLLFPGIMVVIPLALGVVYIFCAASVLRGHRAAIWPALVMSFATACWSGYAANRMGFEAIYLWLNPPPPLEAGEPLPGLGPAGDQVLLREPSPEVLAQFEAIGAAARRRGAAINGLMIVLFVGAASVVVMHARAWRWVAGRNGG